MMEVGQAISSMMKVCGTTKSTLIKVSGNLIMSVVIDMMKDELIVGEHQVEGTRLLIYIYT